MQSPDHRVILRTVDLQSIGSLSWNSAILEVNAPASLTIRDCMM